MLTQIYKEVRSYWMTLRKKERILEA